MSSENMLPRHSYEMGGKIQSKVPNEDYRSGHERIFGKRDEFNKPIETEEGNSPVPVPEDVQTQPTEEPLSSVQEESFRDKQLELPLEP